MKLYYVPGSCSLASHIVLREVGAAFELERYDPAMGVTETGATFVGVNAKGKVPALVTDTGAVLTEGSAVVQYIATAFSGGGLALPADPMARARVQEGLSFVSSDLHKTFSPIFASDTDDAAKVRARTQLRRHLDYLEGLFADGRTWFVDDLLSVADIYLFVVLRWVEAADLDLTAWPRVAGFRARMGARPHSRAALAAEGLRDAA